MIIRLSSTIRYLPEGGLVGNEIGGQGSNQCNRFLRTALELAHQVCEHRVDHRCGTDTGLLVAGVAIIMSLLIPGDTTDKLLGITLAMDQVG